MNIRVDPARDRARRETLARLRRSIGLEDDGETPIDTGFNQPRAHRVLPFGVAAVDAALPGGGLLLGALHEVSDAGFGGVAAMATTFVAAIAARLTGTILWCHRGEDLYIPGLARVGLLPHRVIHAVADDDTKLLTAMDEGLAEPVFGMVVGELRELSMLASRRLQLAAETSGVTAAVIRRDPRVNRAAADPPPTAASTRWRLHPMPGHRDHPARWRVELARVRGRPGGEFIMEGCDAKGHLRPPAPVVTGRAPSPTAGVAAQA